MEPKRIKALRTLRGWTQDELAQRLGVTRITVSNWERGVTSPPRRRRQAIEKLMGEGK